MKVINLDLNKDLNEVTREAIQVLSTGGTIIYPTDTLYGLGANALDQSAVERVFKIKNRSFSKPLPIIARNLKWVEELAFIDPNHKKFLEKVWPGKTTAILPKRDVLPLVLTAETRTIAIRIPDYPFLDFLLGKYGYPITSTSANISGQEPTNDINKIIELFEKERYKPDLIIDAGILKPSEPLTVVDLTSKHPKILRVGPSRPDQLLKMLEI